MLPPHDADPTSSASGIIPFTVPSIDRPCYTYYKVFGDLSCGAIPLIGLHGGPGGGHAGLLPYTKLWLRYGIPVILYDQIGCGHSTHLRHKAGDEAFWQESLFVAELYNLLEFFNLPNGPGYFLLGSSWGAMLGSAFATSQPRGLKRLVLASGAASRELATRGIGLRVNELAQDVQDVINRGLEQRRFDTEEYANAMGVYLRRFLCRLDPIPKEILASMDNQRDDGTVYKTMLGPSVHLSLGSLAEWTVVPRLHRIAVPTLVYNGEYDSSHDVAQTPFFERIPDVRWKTIAGASHSCVFEKQDEVLRLVGDFLTDHLNS
ncbi:hypothetical protein ANO11243_024200 [Dothideomycetidae sp. 11243]|nr:hypothetical protein ANO11243_024200 [fungal sp. No.11243]